MDEPIIEVDRLAKRYRLGSIGATSLRETFDRWWQRRKGGKSREGGEFWALRDVSCTVQRGEVLGVIGRNGAGKSTLLKILSRVTEPTAGRAVIRGRIASLLEVGTGFHPDLTGRENVYLNGSILGMTRAEIRRKFDDIAAFAEIDQFVDTPVKRYSSGMYVRLAFAVAAHLEPEILVVDEVLAVGDVAFQKKCLGKMGQVAGQHGRTVLFVSHQMGAIRGLCQRCLWLDQGRVREIGETGAVIDHYLATYNEAFRTKLSLEAAPRLGGLGKAARITELTLNGGQPIQHDQPFTVDIEFAVASAAEDVSVGIGFSSVEGVRIMSIESDNPGARLSISRPGAHRIRLQVDRCLLQPGTFAVDLGMRSGDFSALDYLGSVCFVEVMPGPTTPSTLVRSSPHVRYPSTWTQTERTP